MFETFRINRDQYSGAVSQSGTSCIIWVLKSLTWDFFLGETTIFVEGASNPRSAAICLYKVLDSVSSASDLAKLETIYELTLDALKATANQRHGAHARYARQRQEGNPSGDEK